MHIPNRNYFFYSIRD